MHTPWRTARLRPRGSPVMLRQSIDRMVLSRHSELPQKIEPEVHIGLVSAGKFAGDDVVPTIGTLLGEIVLFQSGLVRSFDPGSAIGPGGRLRGPRLETGIVGQNV